MKFFTTELKNVKINGTEVRNAMIVTGIQDGAVQPDLTYLIPEFYRGADIMGTRYIPETQTFEQVDAEPIVHEPTQLDRIEADTAYVAMML